MSSHPDVCFLFSEVPTVVHVLSSREQDWTEQEVAVESSPTIIYQEVPGGESQSATSTIKALVELQQTSGEVSSHGKPTGVFTCQHAEGLIVYTYTSALSFKPFFKYK